MQASVHTDEELIGQSFFKAYPQTRDQSNYPGDLNLRTSFEWVIQNKQPHHILQQRYDLPNPDGSVTEKYWKIHNLPVLSDEGDLQHILFTAEDISLQVEAAKKKEELKDVQKTFDLFMQAPVAVCIINYKNYIVELANEHMLQLLGRTSDMVGKPVEASLTEARLQGLLAIFDQVRDTGQSRHIYSLPASIIINGERVQRYFDVVFQPYYQNPGEAKPTGIFCVAYNITELVTTNKKIEQVQEQTERQKRVYEAITRSTPDLIYVFDLNYRFTYANEALLTMWGKTREEAIGKGLRENGYEEWHARMHEREIDEVVATKKSIRGEVSFPHALLGRRIYDYILVPVVNDQGEVEAIVGTTRDITELKKAEETLKQNEVYLQQKVAERTTELQRTVEELKRSNTNLEEFAYAASHDMKEPIRKILFFADRLRLQLQDSLNESQKQNFERLENAAARMDMLIEDLLNYSQVTKGVPHLEKLDLNSQVQFVLDDLEVEIQNKQAHINVAPLPTINANARQMQQLFQNLLTNALKYTRPGTTPEIEVSYTSVKGKELRPDLLREDQKQYHLIQIRDNGIGFSEEDAKRIFNVFTRLHGNAEYKGNGIGLSIVQKVVENHQGHIWADSSPGNGATFKIMLPV